jgi:hypothetical protein
VVANTRAPNRALIRMLRARLDSERAQAAQAQALVQQQADAERALQAMRAEAAAHVDRLQAMTRLRDEKAAAAERLEQMVLEGADAHLQSDADGVSSTSVSASASASPSDSTGLDEDDMVEGEWSHSGGGHPTVSELKRKIEIQRQRFFNSEENRSEVDGVFSELHRQLYFAQARKSG